MVDHKPSDSIQVNYSFTLRCDSWTRICLPWVLPNDESLHYIQSDFIPEYNLLALDPPSAKIHAADPNNARLRNHHHRTLQLFELSTKWLE